MSQLERALEKARAEGGGAQTPGAGNPAAHLPKSEFASSWDFEEPIVRARGAAPASPGAEESGDLVTLVPKPEFASSWDFEEPIDRARVAAPAPPPAPKPEPASRPELASKPEPASRPEPASKPAVASSPELASKPPVASTTAPPSRPELRSKPDRRPRPAPQFKDFNPAVKEKLVVGDDAPLGLREQFRKVAAALYRLRETRSLKVVMVVSAMPGEGKSLASTNLALTLSESYDVPVLLLDADLRRPTLHDLFNVPNTCGLKEGLSASDGIVVSPVRISERLDVMTAGRAAIDPMAALTSDRMRSVIARAADVYDWVVIDTPPVELLPDAGLLTSEADGAILVVRAGSTPYQLAKRSIEAIGRERVLGMILNQLTPDMGPDAHEHYGYYGEPPQPRSAKR